MAAPSPHNGDDEDVTGYRLKQVEEITRAFGPTVGEVAVLSAQFDSLSRALDRQRQDAKEEHEALDEKIENLAKEIRSNRITPLQIIVATSPITVSVISLIGVVIALKP